MPSELDKSNKLQFAMNFVHHMRHHSLSIVSMDTGQPLDLNPFRNWIASYRLDTTQDYSFDGADKYFLTWAIFVFDRNRALGWACCLQYQQHLTCSLMQGTHDNFTTLNICFDYLNILKPWKVCLDYF